MDYFDLHCDTALCLFDRKEQLATASGHISLEKAAALNRYAQIYALFVHDKFSNESAWNQYNRELSYLHRQQKLLGDEFCICTTGPELENALLKNARPAILSVENGKALGGHLERVEQMAKDGVRLLTLTWFRENELGYGSMVGGHFKPFGFEVLKQCRRHGIIPDISHLSDEGVEDVFAADDGVFIASHSNARMVTSHFRNLTDEMIAELVRRKGLIGINFATGFLNEDEEAASIEDICRHIIYFLEQGCQDVLAFGSDFDGAHVPQELHDISQVGRIYDALLKLGIQVEVLQNIFFENAYRFFMENLGGETR